MFQSILLCAQPTGSTNAETLHSGTGHQQSQETRAHKHLVRSALSPHPKKHGRRFWRSQASNPCRIQDGRCILCCLHSVSSIASAVAPRKRRHQRLHPPQFASRQASPLSKVVAHRRQTTMASRLNVEKECFQSMRAVRVHCDENLLPTTNELKGGLVKTKIYKWSQCTCSRCQCTRSRQ